MAVILWRGSETSTFFVKLTEMSLRTRSCGLPTLCRIGKHRIRRKGLLCHSWVASVARLQASNIKNKWEHLKFLCIYIFILERIRTYLLIAVQVVLVVWAHAGVCIVPAGLAALTRVQTPHHPRIQIWKGKKNPHKISNLMDGRGKAERRYWKHEVKLCTKGSLNVFLAR